MTHTDGAVTRRKGTMHSAARRFEFTLPVSLSGRYSVEVDPAGLRLVTKTGAAHSVSWPEIAELRERRVLERVELVDSAGRERARLDYQIIGFEDLLAYVLDHVPAAAPAPAVQFLRRASRGDIIVDGLSLALSAAVTVIALAQREFVGLMVPGLLLGLTAARHFGLVRAVEISGRTVTVCRWLRRTTMDLKDVSAVRIALRPIGKHKSGLDLALEFRNGQRQFIRPGAGDIFALYRATRLAWCSAQVC